MNKLSSRDRQRVTDALSECARQTKEIEDPKKLQDSAYDILADKLGDNPGLFKAACQVYNSCKSIHKLSEATDETRGNNFTILNVQDMATRLADDKKKELRKAASAPSTFTRMRIPSGTIQKAASASVEKPKYSETYQGTIADHKSYMKEELDDICAFIQKFASKVNTSEAAMYTELEKFAAHFATETATMRKEAAARLYANYADKATTLLEATGVIRPLCKLASADYAHKYKGTPSIPSTGLYKAASVAMDAISTYRKDVSDFETALKEVSDEVCLIGKAYSQFLKKSAAAKPVFMADASELLEAAGLLGDEQDSDKLKEKIYTAEFTNALLAHSHKRALMRALANPVISKYGIPYVVQSYNRSIAKLPPNQRQIPATANQALIESMMIADLATGSIPSKADVDVIANLADTLGKMKSESGVFMGNEV